MFLSGQTPPILRTNVAMCVGAAPHPAPHPAPRPAPHPAPAVTPLMQTVGYRGAAIPAMPLYTSQVTMTPPIVLQQTRQPVQAPVTLAPALVRTVEAPSPAASSPATLWQVNLPHRPIPTEAADSVGGLRQVSARGAGLRRIETPTYPSLPCIT